jgi:hypothetical protein
MALDYGFSFFGMPDLYFRRPSLEKIENVCVTSIQTPFQSISDNIISVKPVTEGASYIRATSRLGFYYFTYTSNYD